MSVTRSCNTSPSDPGFLSPDLVYKKVPLGGQGDFPPASFGFGPPHIVGTPIEAFANLGQSPSPTGMAFMPTGPDAGQLVVAEYGATNDPAVGRDVLLLDPVTGARGCWSRPQGPDRRR
jgi:hypothetical protein